MAMAERPLWIGRQLDGAHILQVYVVLPLWRYSIPVCMYTFVIDLIILELAYGFTWLIAFSPGSGRLRPYYQSSEIL
jgi:hypothetical protein